MSAERLSVGQPVARVDGRLKVTGHAAYAADHRPGPVLHAVIVESTVGRGRVRRIDDRAALAHPGVIDVIHHGNAPRLPNRPHRGVTDPAQGVRLEVLQDDRVRFFGQPVALVVATTLEAAHQGARLVEVHYRSHRPRLDVSEGPTTIPARYHRGRADPALRNAPVRLDLTYRAGRNHHNPMETHATIARWQGNRRVTVWDKSQYVAGAQQELAAVFGLPEEAVHVISPFVGGAFGSALRSWPHTALAALAARRLQCAVKLVLTRRQMYAGTGFRPAYEYRLSVGSTRQGRLLAMTHHLRSETSRFETFTESAQALGQMLYSTPHVRQDYAPVPLDVNTPTYMRGPGYASAAWAIESAVDELAVELRVDPIDLRLLNEPARDQSTEQRFSTRRLRRCLEEGAELFGWAGRDPRPRSRVEGDWLIGTGVAAGCYDTARSAAAAQVIVGADGRATVRTATSDMGPGTYTSMTQVAADHLGFDPGDIEVHLGDSRLPLSPPHGGSQTMASVGSAVAAASAKMRQRAIRLAVSDPVSPLHGLTADEVTTARGRIFSRRQPSRGERFAEVARRQPGQRIVADGMYTPGDPRFSMYAYSGVFVEVAVDADLGLVRVRRMLGAYDAGRIVNPRLAESQAFGGMIGGIGAALLEETHTDHRDGRIVNANIADYLVPVNADIPDLRAVYLDGEDERANPLGVKGLGEIVQVGVAPAIANAVYHATGTRVRDLPISLESLL